MAKQAFVIETLVLQDDKEVRVRPLPIARLRRFMKAWTAINDITEEDSDEGFGVLINCSGIALEDTFKGDFESLRASAEESKKGEYLSAEYKEYLENVLDLDTIYVIMDVAGGIKLNDPKLLEVAQSLE